ncbi:MAG: hypothetical protein HYT94_00500 [Parcubacteria group bacterium]|nr:hypothetical protein [Parcubacteria group bacterium]
MFDVSNLILDTRDDIEDPEELSRAELAERQLAEILGEDNRRYAENALGREARVGDLIVHYAQNGGPENFAERHGRQTCIVRIDCE